MMSNSFMTAIDVIIIALLVIGIFMMLMGKGDEFMNLFRGSKSGPSPYDPEKEKKATFFLMIVLLICEMIYVFISKYWAASTLIALILAIISIIVYIIYLKKFAQK